jgi:hypothetical protein
MTCALALALFASRALAWGELGHRAIGELARQRLSSGTRAHVVAILGNDDLAAISNWAVDVRSAGRGEGPLVHDAEALAFGRRFPHNDHWHYTSLPLAAVAYPDASPFTSDDDIVHAIECCIASLESPSSRAEIPHAEALRVLVHLVGDLHQPMHLAEGYYRSADAGVPQLVADATSPAGLLSDRGANALHFGEQRLHFVWDITLVDRLAAARTPSDLAALLAHEAVPRDPTGPASSWARQWVADVLPFAREAYAGIEFRGFSTDARYGPTWEVRWPADYESRSIAHVRVLLARAGYRLASLLERIRWAT